MVATMDEENARPRIMFEAHFPSGYIRPVGRGVVLDVTDNPNWPEIYLDEWFEEEVLKAGGGPNLTSITIRVEIESAAGK